MWRQTTTGAPVRDRLDRALGVGADTVHPTGFACMNTFPPDRKKVAAAATGKTSRRRQDLPAPVILDYVPEWTLSWRFSSSEVLRCRVKGIKWWREPQGQVKVPGKPGISHVRARPGWEPLKRLQDEAAASIAARRTKAPGIAIGAWSWCRGAQWRLPASRDGSA